MKTVIDTGITRGDREMLLNISSRITTLADDEHLVVDNARALEAWAIAEGDCDDVAVRLDALSHVFHNLTRRGLLPMDRPEEMTARAAAFYEYLNITTPDEGKGDDVVYLGDQIDIDDLTG